MDYNENNFLPSSNAFPEHIAIIPDGGRRWAKEHACTIVDSYRLSMIKIHELIAWSMKRGVQEVSVFMSSTYNFKRSEEEVEAFCVAEWEYFSGVALQYALLNNIRIRIVGSRDKHLNQFLEKKEIIENQTRNGDRYINFCFNYNSFDEIENAKGSYEKSSFLNRLKIKRPVNLMIRTGGAKVLSCFLLPQLAFARLFFVDKLFNDFSVDDYSDCINEYLGYELKYGE